MFPDPTVAQYRTMAAIDTSAPEEMTPQIYHYLQTLPPYGIKIPLIYWSSDPNINIPISTASLLQSSPLVASDGQGGAYIAWSHSPGFPSPASVWAQRVDAFGAVQWMNNGIPVAVGPDVQTVMDIIADGQGNAIISWQVRRTGSYDIMVQKINRFGKALWTSNGVSITTVVNDIYTPWPKLTSDGQGGAIIVWMETHSGSGYIHAQRIGASGDIQWTPDGVLINSTAYNADELKVARDDTDGIIITWTDIRGGKDQSDIYAQKIKSSGLVQWTADGVRICNATGYQAAAVLVSNGVGGAIVTWLDYGVGVGCDIYTQQVDSSGQSLWTTNGIRVTSIAGFKTFLRTVNDGSHGAILSWLDPRRTNYLDSYVQRIDSGGVARWTTNGVALTDTLGCSESTIISDNNRGAIIIFVRNVFQSNIKYIFAQHMDSTGSILWARNGLPISLADGAPAQVSATTDLAGGAIIVWKDNRNVPLNSGINHIYAQNVTSTGGLGGGVTTGVDRSTAGELPSKVSLQQNYPNPFNPSTTIQFGLPNASYVTLKIYNILGQEVATLINEKRDAGQYSVQWNAHGLASGVYFYRLSAGNYIETKKLLLVR